MTNHPNRSRRKDVPARSPEPREIAQLRKEMQMTQAELARHLYASTRSVEDWEAGRRTMPALVWEYVCLLWAYPQVERARRLWIEGRADVPVV